MKKEYLLISNSKEIKTICSLYNVKEEQCEIVNIDNFFMIGSLPDNLKVLREFSLKENYNKYKPILLSKEIKKRIFYFFEITLERKSLSEKRKERKKKIEEQKYLKNNFKLKNKIIPNNLYKRIKMKDLSFTYKFLFSL